MKKPTPTDFEPNDFVIRLRPHMEQEEWNGDVDISIMWDGTNHLSQDDFFRFMHLAKMICASVPMMLGCCLLMQRCLRLSIAVNIPFVSMIIPLANIKSGV